MRNFQKSRFKKVIALTKEDYNFITKNKERKSLAGFLEEIIKFFKKQFYQ